MAARERLSGMTLKDMVPSKRCRQIVRNGAARGNNSLWDDRRTPAKLPFLRTQVGLARLTPLLSIHQQYVPDNAVVHHMGVRPLPNLSKRLQRYLSPVSLFHVGVRFPRSLCIRALLTSLQAPTTIANQSCLRVEPQQSNHSTARDMPLRHIRHYITARCACCRLR